METIFDEVCVYLHVGAHTLELIIYALQPSESPRNLLQLHKDRRYKKEVTYVWIGTEKRAVV